jgi:hypothetical protein
MQFHLLSISPGLDELYQAREGAFLLHHLEDFFVGTAILQQERCDNMKCWSIIFLR